MGKYRRVMLKLSGEALAGESHMGLDEDRVRVVATEVLTAYEQGIQIAVVIGGGNFWRGRTGTEIDRVSSDQIGMLATVMNALYVSEIFRSLGMKTALYGAFEIPGIMPVYERDLAERSFDDGNVIFFAGGTGHPYFSTDTGTVLRAAEIGADIILLAKSVDGVYDCDPATHPDARRFDTISLGEVLARELKVIDLTASALCKEAGLTIGVFSLSEPGHIRAALTGDIRGTIVTPD